MKIPHFLDTLFAFSIRTLLQQMERFTESEYLTLARIYCMSDRLQAGNFRSAILERFQGEFNDNCSLSDQTVCEMLKVLTVELPRRPRIDPMQDQIYWYAARRLFRLQKRPCSQKRLKLPRWLKDYACAPVIARHYSWRRSLSHGQ